MKTYLRILSFAKPLRNFFPYLIITTILAVVFELLNMSFIGPVLKILFSEESSSVILTPMPEFEWSQSYFEEIGNWLKLYLISFEDKTEALKIICLVLLTSVFLANLFTFLSRYILAFVKAKMVKNIRVTLYKKINRLHLGYYTNENRGDLISRMTNDAQEVESSIVASIHAMIKGPATIIFTFTVLFYLSKELVVFSLFVLPISGLVIWKLSQLLRKKAKQGQNYLGEILGTIDETLGGLKIIFSFNSQQYFIDKFLNQNVKYERALRSMDYKKGLASPLSQFLGVTVFCLILYYGGVLVLKDNYMPPENFLVFVLLFANVISPLKSLFSVVANIQRGLIAGDRIFEVLDAREEILEAKNPKPFNDFTSAISFKNISFKYEEKDVLKHLNLEIEKGKTIALVGTSGGGKSTIINLIPRFFDVYNGEILIDGEPIKDLKITDLRGNIGIVTQDSILFNDSIYNNIAFGIADQVTPDQVERAAKIANAHEFIEQSIDGYQTKIGDNGTKLSGGQKQRLCIARAVLKNPPIMLLDEATSALDTESEQLVQEALNKLMENRTSVVVAHRLSTIQNADEIVVIDKGEILEKGTHQELLLNSKVYKKLIEIQQIKGS